METTKTTTRKEIEMIFTHPTYEAAQAALKVNKRNKVSNLVTWDAGDGWRGEGYYCSRRNRIITGCSNGLVTIY